jgi:TonB family protein
MNNLVCSVASYLVNSVWEVALIGGGGWVVSRLLKRLGPQVEHVAWVVTLLLVVVTPALPVWPWLVNTIFASAGMREGLSIAFVSVNGGQSHTANAALLPPVAIFALLACYALTLFYFVARLCWSLYLTIKLLRTADPLSLDTGRQEVWRQCQRELSVRDARMLSSEQIAGPVTIAFGRPVLLLPASFSEECSEHDFLAAVAHECAHMQRGDFQKNLLYEIASLFISFHPVTWMVKSKIAQTREMICDATATEKLIDSRTYTQSLLRLATFVSLSSQVACSYAIGIFDADILEERVMMMTRKKQHYSVLARYGLMIPAAVLLFSVAAGAGGMTVAIAPQESSQSSEEAQKITKDVTPPKLISSPSPVYPESERKVKGKFDGSCVVGMVVDKDGITQDVHIVRSLGPDFDASAIQAVQQYRFTPATKAGAAISVKLSVEVNFKKF